MKNFNNYKKEIDLKYKVINMIIDFMDNYQFEYYTIGSEYDDYIYDGVNIKNDIVYFSYEHNSKTYVIEISEISFDIVHTIYDNFNEIFSIDRLLEIGGISKKSLKIVLSEKNKIHWKTWMFYVFAELEDEDIINSYDIQKLLFTNYPESFNFFMVVSDDNNDIILHDDIETEFPILYKNYLKSKNSKKFNL